MNLFFVFWNLFTIFNVYFLLRFSTKVLAKSWYTVACFDPIYSWDSRNCRLNSPLLFKYWLKYTKLVGFTRFISYTSFYVFFISFICILLSPSPKTSVVPTRLTQRSGAESHDNEGPKQIRCNYLFQIISSIPTKLTTVWRVCFKIMSLIYQCFLTCV